MPGLGGPAARVAGERHAAGRRAVIGAVAREDLVAAGRHPRQLDRVLVGFGAAVGEEEHVDVARARSRRACAPSRARGSVAMNGFAYASTAACSWIARIDALVAVADVHAHQLAVEVDEPLAFRRPEVDPLGARDRDRIDLRLRRPLEERVLLRQRDHLFAGHRLVQGFGRHLEPSFSSGVAASIRILCHEGTKTRRHETKTRPLRCVLSCRSASSDCR